MFAAWSTGNDQAVVSVVLAVARSKFRQRQYFFNTVYRFITVTNAFFNILINHYIVCE